MSHEPSITPPFVVFQKPLFRFNTVEFSGDGQGDTIPVPEIGIGTNIRKSSAQSISRVFIDEVANDIVIFSFDSREVCFYQLLLHDSSEETEGSSAPSGSGMQHNPQRVSEEEWLRHHPMLSGDAISLRVVPRNGSDETVIYHAKRCPNSVFTSATGPAHLIALSLNTEAVFFFMCYLQPNVQGEGAQCQTIIATYQCTPRNLRFRKDFYPVCAFYWAENLWSNRDGARGQAPYRGLLLKPFTVWAHQRRQQSVSRGSDSAACPTRRILCITSISIDLISVQCTGRYNEGKDGWVILNRYVTHTDYWHYCPAALSILSINRLKPWHVKVFEVRDREGLCKLPALRVEENFLAAEGEKEATASSLIPAAACMTTSSVRYPVVLLALYQQLFVCTLSKRSGGVTLFRYVPAPDDGRGGGMGQFAMYGVLRVDFPLQIRRDPIVLQVVDNLILLHAPRQGISAAFDILHCDEDVEERWHRNDAPHDSSFVSLSQTMESEPQYRSGRAFFPPFGVNADGEDYASRKSYSQSSWFTWLSNMTRNNCIAKGRLFICSDDITGEKLEVPVLYPLLSAALSLHPQRHEDGCAPVSPEDGAIYKLDFVSGTLPLLLDRRNGAVHLVGINPFTLAVAMPQTTQRVHFYLNRMYCAGKVVHSLLRTMLSKHRPLVALSHAFELVTAHNMTHCHLQGLCGTRCRGSFSSATHESTARISAGSETVPQRQCFSRTVLLLGNMTALCRWLPLKDGTGVLPDRPPWRRRGCLTLQDVLATCTTCCGAQGHRDVSLLEESVTQESLERDVFAPLLGAVLRHTRGSAATAWEEETAGAVAMEGVASPHGGSSDPHLHMCRYLFYVLLEYARCVAGTGFALSEGLQRSLMYLLSHAAGDCGPLHHQLRFALMTDHPLRTSPFFKSSSERQQLGMEMLMKPQTDAQAIQTLLHKNRVVQAARYLYNAEVRPQQELGPTERLLHARLMGDIFRAALEAVEEEERGLLLQGGRNHDGGTGARGQRAVEFVIVYEIIIGCLLSQPLFHEVVPQQFLSATAKYQQLLAASHTVSCGG
uniref:Mic1 domain-containing protein n=1 Tax=Trypanosoma congolense (strain IL3000) TaxID=1068625 RepID=G0UQR5_TRYCI|nr:conserved hypothetical protein [Trypanosoma congolense IL3000]